jgi:hypothetical protein
LCGSKKGQRRLFFWQEMTFNTQQMQGPVTTWLPGVPGFWDALWMFGCGVVVTVIVAALLARPRRRVDERVFRRLLHRVHDRREALFAVHQPPRLNGLTRERFLQSARERLRACAYFQRRKQ